MPRISSDFPVLRNGVAHAAPLLALGVCLFCLTGLLRADWQELETVGVFRLRSEFHLGDASGRLLLQQMARLQVDVERLLNLEPGVEPIEVNLFRTQWTYKDFLGDRLPENVTRPALFVKGTDMGRVYVYRHWGFEKDLRHECTHAVLHNALPYVPLWLDEGLAEYFEVPDDERASGNPHMTACRLALAVGWQADLRRLEKLSSMNEMDGGDYRESWAWVHFLLHGPIEVRQVLSDYLYDIKSGRLAGALSTRLYEAFPDADIRLANHLRHWNG